MALLHDRREHHLRLPYPRAEHATSLQYVGISSGSGTVCHRGSRAAVLHVHRQAASFAGWNNRDDTGDAGWSPGVLVFREAEESRLTTEDTEKFFSESREIPLVAKHRGCHF